MNLGIVGSRHYANWAEFEAHVQRFLAKHNDGCLPQRIISGGASGADRMAERFAAKHGIELCVFNADWERFGKRAGPLRNRDIARSATHLLAFVAEDSRGTWITVRIARLLSRKVEVIKV